MNYFPGSKIDNEGKLHDQTAIENDKRREISEVSSENQESCVSEKNEHEGVENGEINPTEENNQSKIILNETNPRDVETTRDVGILDSKKTSRGILSEEEYSKYENLAEELRNSIISIREDEKKPISFIHILFFVLMTGFGICFTIFRGTQNRESVVGIAKCSGGFYGLLLTYIAIMLGLSGLISFYLIKKNKICEAAGYDFEVGDIHWNIKKCIFFICMGILIGILVGVIGFGGFIVSPILLHLNIDPEITTLSSIFTIMLTSLSAFIQFYIAGVTNWKYSLYLMACAHIGSLIAILVVRKFFLRIGRKSFLVFALVFIFFASLFIIPTFGVINLINQRNENTFQLGFKSIC